jgi:hypothetical protein
MARELGDAFATAGYAFLFDALLPFVSPAHHGWIQCWSPLAAALVQALAHLGRFWGPQKYQRSALSLAVKSVRRVVL